MPVLGPDAPKIPTNHFLCEVGTVTVENMGLGGVTVMLSGMADGQTTTDDSGQYSFTGLRAGTYSVEISSFDTNEVSFSSTSGAATVGVGESKVVSFDGTYLRTAGIQGQVSVDGEGLQGVMVTLVGEGEDRSETTNSAGQYAFSQLKSGTYQVAITNPDPDDYEFATTSKTATIATGETANVPFEGTLLRTAGIAGRVSLDDGMGLDGVTVTLAGAAEATAETSNGGQYSFAGLAAGTYVLSITNPDANAYNFAEDEMQKTVMLEDDQSAIVNFSGTHTRTASVSGMLFIDEVDQNKMYDDGEPSITEAIAPLVAAGALDAEVVAGLLAKAKVKLRGPDLNTMQDISINADGSFTTGASLMAGSYQVELPVNDDDVAAGLAAAGVAFVGESAVVTVEAGGNAMVNFPFRITTQTVATGARMGGGGAYGAPVAGVKLALYARADGTDMLGEATTDDMGMASFSFARADNTGPAGNDNIVFVKVMASGHDALVVSGNEFVEIAYASTARLYAADAEKEAATLVNVAAGFDFWVKSNEMARDGDKGLGGWNTVVYMGDPEAEGAMPLMMVDEDGDTVSATMPTDDGEDNMADLGKSSFAYTVDPTMLPAMFTVMATEGDKGGQPDQGEAWEQGDALTYTHTGLELPSDEMADLGPIRVTFTTQAVYVGVHRELDDRTGFTDYIGIGGSGDGPPSGTAVGDVEVSLMAADSRGRLRVLEYDHDANPETPDKRAEATAGAKGIVSFKNIPADMEITVVADEGSGKVVVPDSRASREIDAYGAQLDDYPDGVIVGSFGAGSGARPDMWLCPLQRQASDDPNEVCSTYAYKWATGTISGSIGGLRQGDKATVTLTAVNSNEAYADDLADDVEVTAGRGGAAEYEFTGVADGRYMVTLEANAGSWPENKTGVISVMHDEDNDADDYTGEVVSGASTELSATDLRGVIRGRIANDSNGRTGLTSDESRAGVMVGIYTAKKVGGTGPTKNNYVADKAVTDADGDPVMAETGRDGVFMFEGLVVEDMYFLKPESTDLYTAVRNGNPMIGATAEKATAVVTHALVEAGLPPKAGTEPGTPTWDYNTSMATPNGDANFVLLYKDGEVIGGVSDPSVRGAHSRSDVELHQCMTTDFVLDSDPDTDGNQTTDATRCTEYTGVVEIASVDARGNWSKGGLREGVYEVVVDLPAGYVNVDSKGRVSGETDFNVQTTGTTDENEGTFHRKQIAQLAGGRADAGTATFHIKDDNAGDGIEISSVLVDGDACGTNTAGSAWTSPDVASADARCADNDPDDGSIDVTVTASTGATIKLSTSASTTVPSSTVRVISVTNGEKTAVSLPKGRTTFFLHVAAEDGYADNSGVPSTDRDLQVGRNADVRLNSVTIKWSGVTLTLDRDELDLDPDGEDKPITGAVDLGTITLTGLGEETTLTSVSGTAKDAAFGSVAVTAAVCPATQADTNAASSALTTGATLTDHDSNDDTPIQLTVCFSIGDYKSDTDENEANGHQYQAVLRAPAS